MANYAQHINIIQPIPTVRYCDGEASIFNAFVGTCDSWSQKEDALVKWINEQYVSSDTFNIDCTSIPYSKHFIQHIQKFDLLFKKYEIADVNHEEAKTVLEQSLSQLLNLDIDAFSSELTYESSLFFTLKKDEYSFYIEQFLIEDEEDNDLVLTAFNGKSLIFTMSGSLSSIIKKIDTTIFNDLNIEDVVITAHELSY